MTVLDSRGLEAAAKALKEVNGRKSTRDGIPESLLLRDYATAAIRAYLAASLPPDGENPYREEADQMRDARIMAAAWDEGFAAGRAAAPAGERITHGRHCICSACAAEDWTNPQLAPCGMHGSSCPREYAPLGPAGRAAASPDPPDMTNMCEGESPDHKPGITPAASPDERLREALALIAQHARLDLTERSIAEAERYAAIAEDALAATDRRGTSDE